MRLHSPSTLKSSTSNSIHFGAFWDGWLQRNKTPSESSEGLYERLGKRYTMPKKDSYGVNRELMTVEVPVGWFAEQLHGQTHFPNKDLFIPNTLEMLLEPSSKKDFDYDALKFPSPESNDTGVDHFGDYPNRNLVDVIDLVIMMIRQDTQTRDGIDDKTIVKVLASKGVRHPSPAVSEYCQRTAQKIAGQNRGLSMALPQAPLRAPASVEPYQTPPVKSFRYSADDYEGLWNQLEVADSKQGTEKLQINLLRGYPKSRKDLAVNFTRASAGINHNKSSMRYAAFETFNMFMTTKSRRLSDKYRDHVRNMAIVAFAQGGEQLSQPADDEHALSTESITADIMTRFVAQLDVEADEQVADAIQTSIKTLWRYAKDNKRLMARVDDLLDQYVSSKVVADTLTKLKNYG